MSRLAQAAAIHAVASASPVPSFMERLRRHFAPVEAAMPGQARLCSISPETESDTGFSAEELTGETSYDPALPFFLQSGFGDRDR